MFSVTELILVSRGELLVGGITCVVAGFLAAALLTHWADERALARERAANEAYRRTCVARHDDVTLDLSKE